MALTIAALASSDISLFKCACESKNIFSASFHLLLVCKSQNRGIAGLQWCAKNVRCGGRRRHRPQNGAPNCRRRKPCLTPAQRIRHLHTREGAYAAPMPLAGAMPRAGAPLKSQKAQRHRCASLISSTKSPDFRHLRSSTRTQRVPCRQRYCPQTLSCLSTRDL